MGQSRMYNPVKPATVGTQRQTKQKNNTEHQKDETEVNSVRQHVIIRKLLSFHLIFYRQIDTVNVNIKQEPFCWNLSNCLTPSEQFLNSIMIRTTLTSIRFILLYWTNMISWMLIVLAHITQIPSKPFFALTPVMLCAWRRSKYQCYSFWFDRITTRTHNLPQLKQIANHANHLGI